MKPKLRAVAAAAALLLVALSLPNAVRAQSGPWAKYDGKMKGEALIRESDGGSLREVQSIVEGGGDVNWQLTPTGLTPLMAAASAGHADVVAFLLGKGADAALKDANGRTALDRAVTFGANDVAKLLRQATTGSPPTPPNAAPAPSAIPAPAVPAPAVPATRWAPFGTYRPGDRVQFFAGGWKLGTVKEVGAAGSAGAKAVAPGERKYLIAPDAYPTWPDWVTWGSVAGPAREPFWTGFFVGAWALGETMAVNGRTDGTNAYDEFAFHAATEALRVNADGTYAWKATGGRVVTGRWTPATDGPGIVLVQAYRGKDWTLRNETNAAEENIRGLETARLTTPGVMSVLAHRPLGR